MADIFSGITENLAEKVATKIIEKLKENNVTITLGDRLDESTAETATEVVAEATAVAEATKPATKKRTRKKKAETETVKQEVSQETTEVSQNIKEIPAYGYGYIVKAYDGKTKVAEVTQREIDGKPILLGYNRNLSCIVKRVPMTFVAIYQKEEDGTYIAIRFSDSSTVTPTLDSQNLFESVTLTKPVEGTYKLVYNSKASSPLTGYANWTPSSLEADFALPLVDVNNNIIGYYPVSEEAKTEATTLLANSSNVEETTETTDSDTTGGGTEVVETPSDSGISEEVAAETATEETATADSSETK